MGRNFYIADLHIGHDNLLKNGRLHERPFETMGEMTDTIRDNWNSVVTNADTVYLLGDVSYRADPAFVAEYLSSLKGKRVLIRGNHDNFCDRCLIRQFAEICDYKEITDNIDGKAYSVVLSHYPIFSWKGQFRGAIHLYGHVHDNEDEYLYRDALFHQDEHFAVIDGEHHKPFRAVNVGCMMDYMDYTPRTLKEILKSREMLK